MSAGVAPAKLAPYMGWAGLTGFMPRFPDAMRALLDLLFLILQMYSYVIIATAIMSWLLAFDVINFRNELVRSIWNFLNALTEPVLRPIRRLLPNLGGVDVSPIILLLLIWFIEHVIQLYVYPNVY